MADDGEDLTNGPSTSKGKKRSLAPVLLPPRSPQIKRKRIPAEYYQSDVVEAISKQSVRTPSAEKEVIFNKDTFLAVRTDNGKFFVCKTAQNVYRTTKLFKILWLELRSAPGTYEMSYRDTINIDSVLTDVSMNKQAGGLLKMPQGEIDRVGRVLGLAIKKENGLLDNDDAPRFLEMKDIKRDASEEDDNDDEEEEEEEEEDFEEENEEEEDDPSTSSPQDKKTPRAPPKKRYTKKLLAKAKASVATPQRVSQTRGRGRPKGVVTTKKKAATTVAKRLTVKAKTAKGKVAATAIKGKTKAKKVATPKKKEKKEKVKKIRVKLHPNDKLTLNPNIEVVSKDPLFEGKTELHTSKVSKFLQCKHSIRAVLTNDIPLLKKLVDNVHVPDVLRERSADVTMTALDYAIIAENQAAVKLLLPEIESTRKREEMPQVIMKSHGTGSYNFRTLGHAVREINMGRGSREGNNAFTKDMAEDSSSSDNYIQHAMRSGVSMKTINMILALHGHGKYLIEMNIHLAVKAGQRILAGNLIHKSLGTNFNKLHEEVLLVDKPENLSPFKAPSAKKKPYQNDRVTPIHCAAINPNPKILAKVLSVCGEYAIADSKGRKPIHYAAACQGSGPLEFLLARGMNPDDTDNKGTTPLMIAAKYGRQQNVVILLKKIEAGNINEAVGVKKKSMLAEYPLHYAAREGHVECAKLLIKHGADIEAMVSATNNKITSLMIAAQLGYFQLARALVDLRAVIEKRDKIKRTALMLACINGHYPVATLLLHRGADPNAKDSSGNTPVHYAAAYGWWHCLKLLLKAGGDPNAFNDWKTPPLGIALMKGHTECADLLLEHTNVDLNFRDDNGSTLVMLVGGTQTTKFIVDQMRYLITKGADINLVDITGKNALHYLATVVLPTPNTPAGIAGDAALLEMAKLLIEKGCNASAKDNWGNTPINLALQKTYFSMDLVKLFLDEGCSLSLDADSNGINALHVMAGHCTHNAMGALLSVIAKTNQRADEPMTITGDKSREPVKKQALTLQEAARTEDYNGCTPLLRCVINNASDGKNLENILSMLKGLIDVAKCDVNVVVASKKDRVKPSYDEQQYKMVERNDSQYEGASGLHLLSVANNIPALWLLLDAKPRLDILDRGGFTPLHRAIFQKREASAKLLIDAGANVNLCTADKQGDRATPLILAARAGLHDILSLLVAKGAKVAAKDSKHERTALHYITMSTQDVSKNLATIKVLLNAGADVNSTDSHQRTPLHYSVNMDTGKADVTTEVPEFLIEKKAQVFVKDVRGRLPLHYAFVKISRHRDKTQTDPIEIVNVVLDAMKGQQLNTQDKFGQTPLHWAAYRGATISAMHLAERIKDFNVKDNNGNTPLAMCALGGHDSVAIVLMQKSANINTTVTFVPPELEDERASGSDPAQPKPWQWKPVVKPALTPLKASFFQAAVTEGWQGVVYLMMDRLQKFGLSFVNVIQAVLEAQKYQLASTMIRKQKDPKKLQETTRRASTILHLLAMHAVPSAKSNVYEEVAASLFSRGVKLFARDDKGCTPLHYAAANQNAALCKLFAEKDMAGFKSCLCCADHKKRTPLSSVFWNLQFDSSTEEIIKLMLKFKADLNVRTVLPNVGVRTLLYESQESLEAWYHGPAERSTLRTPLIHYIHLNKFDGVKFLLKNKASCNFADDIGHTPLMHAVRQNETKIVKLLLNVDHNPEDEYRPHPPNYGKKETLSAWAANVWEQKKSVLDAKLLQEQVDYDADSYVEEAVEEEDEVEDEDGSVEGKGKSKDHTRKTYKNLSGLEVNATDNAGRTVIHHLVRTSEFGTFENAALLELLAKVDAKLAVRDKDGKTALDVAIKESRSHRLAAALQRLQGVKKADWVLPKPLAHSWTDGIPFTTPRPDFEADAKAMLKMLEAQGQMEITGGDDRKVKATVEKASGLTEGGVVLMDEEQNIPYNILMTKVDVNTTQWGMFNFYVMQIIHQTGKDMIVLFTRWGHIGEVGQYQKTPFNTKEEAVKEFHKIFKAKSGNNWSNYKDFQKEPKKYQLIKEDPWRAKRRKTLKDFNFNFKSNIPSRLHPKIQGVIRELTRPELLSRALSESSIDTKLIHLGDFLPRENLIQAKQILEKIEVLINENEADKEKTCSNLELQQTLTDKMCDLSNEYFELIPMADFTHDKISPLINMGEFCKYSSRLEILLDLSTINMILLGAQYRINQINPLDYIYQVLGCQIRLTKEDDPETQLILRHIHDSKCGKAVDIEAIFHLSRDGEDARLASCGLDNHKLLWHGSKSSNILGIMKKGLLIAPVEAALTGFGYGQGIYTSDAFAKSIDYCPDYFQQTDSKFLCLCEVALGNMQVFKDEEKTRKGFNSTLARGYYQYQHNRDVLLPTGAVLPLGKLDRRRYCRTVSTNYNEYIAYDEKQVCLRYLVQVMGDKKKKKKEVDGAEMDNYTVPEFTSVDQKKKDDCNEDDEDDEDDDDDEDEDGDGDDYEDYDDEDERDFGV